MPPVKRLAIAMRGAILWVLLSCLLGFMPLLAVPNHAMASIPLIAAAFGVIGASAHALVTAVKPAALSLHASAVAVALLSSGMFLALTHWLFGTPSQPAEELQEVLLYVVAPAVGLSYVVLLLERRLSAA